MKSKYNFILNSAIIMCFGACNNVPQSTNSVQSPPEKPTEPKWLLETKMDTFDTPQTQIFIILKDTVKITDATASFRELGKEEFMDKKIPKEAIVACYGFWAGLEQQFIVIDSSNTWVVKRKMIDSESPEGHEEVFEKLMEIKK